MPGLNHFPSKPFITNKNYRILAAEAYLQEQINQARAIEVNAEARRRGILLVLIIQSIIRIVV